MVQVHLYHFYILKIVLLCSTVFNVIVVTDREKTINITKNKMNDSASYSEVDDSDRDKDFQPSTSSSSDNSADELDYSDQVVKKKGKKRLRYPELEKRQVRKNKRNTGQEYVGHKDLLKRAKMLQNYEHKCRYQCNEITHQERQEIFSSFWKIGNWNLQTAYISSCVQISEPKRKRQAGANSKTKSVVITLKNKRVCKMFFLKTLDISNGRYSRAINKKTSLGFSTTDARGKAPCPNKVSEESIRNVKTHINLFPKYESHYTRHYNPNKRYLPSYLTIKKMYQCYTEFCSESNIVPVKEWCYRKIFNTEFNLSFHQPLSDTCDKCDRFEVSLKACKNDEEQNAIKVQKELHQRQAAAAVQAKRNAKILAQTSSQESVVAVCFDLQKTLPTPSLTTNKVFYMRVLWTYNLGIHNLGKNCASMFMWDESTASRGSQEIGSCLYKFVSKLGNDTKHLIAFTDSCAGQNKNKNMAKFLMHIVRETKIETVDHKFLESGHTYMECDEDFGVIEKYKKQVPYVYIPNEWMEAVKKSSKKFEVFEMKSDDFYSVENYTDVLIKDIKKDDDNKQIKWRDIKWIRVEKSRPFVMQFKYTLNEDMDFHTVDCAKKVPGRKPQHIRLSQLYTTPITLKYEKFKNLQDLLPYVPPIYHDFYKNLNHTNPPAKKTKKTVDPQLPKTSQEDSDIDDRILMSDYNDE